MVQRQADILNFFLGLIPLFPGIVVSEDTILPHLSYGVHPALEFLDILDCCTLVLSSLPKGVIQDDLTDRAINFVHVRRGLDFVRKLGEKYLDDKMNRNI